MTREPTEPLSSDEPSPVASDGGPAPSAWQADDEAGTSEAETAAAAADGKSSSVPGPGAKGAGKDDDLDLDYEQFARREPWRLSHMMLAIVVIAIVLWLWITLGAVGVVLTPIGLIVIAITAGFVWARLRTSRQEALMSLLAIAVERGVPLAPAVAALADQFRGRAQRRILGVAAQLDDGQPLSEALESPYRVLSRDALLMVRVGQVSGLLGPALRLIGGSRQDRVNAWSSIASRLAYLLVIMMFAETISGFLLYFIVPKFEAIFADFRVPLPSITISLIHASHLLVRYGLLTFVICMAQLGLFLFLPFSFGGWMNYQVPIFDRLLARRHAALVLRALSVVIEANKPIGTGLYILAERYPAKWVRRRLARASTDVQMGADWIDALWRRGVIRRADAEVLASAASVGNLVWACRELADTAERRQQLRLQVLIQSLFPLAVLAMGVAVATICLGYFTPLVILIQRLSDV